MCVSQSREGVETRPPTSTTSEIRFKFMIRLFISIFCLYLSAEGFGICTPSTHHTCDLLGTTTAQSAIYTANVWGRPR